MRLLHGDCFEVMRTLPDCSVDAVVTDPPYGLSFMGKKWDYDVPSVEVWAECLRVLKPGGHLLAFAGTRTQHRMAVRIEDAGFEIRDMITWVYGSGFPKSLDVSKAIDKAAGAEREVVGKAAGMEKQNPEWNGTAAGRAENSFKPEYDITAPATDAARQWQGWGTALKPALEPITVARKPLAGTVAENVLRYGTGGLNVDGCRIEPQGDGDYNHTGNDLEHTRKEREDWRMPSQQAKPNAIGRWPANLIHDGSEEVLAGFPQAGGGFGKRGGNGSLTSYGFSDGSMETVGYGDSGSAARFFYCAKASKRDRDEGLEGFGHASAGEMTGGREEGSAGLNNPRAGAGRTGGGRNIHPTVKPTDLMRYLCRLVTPPGGIVLDPFMGSGSTGKAAALEGFDFIGIEREAEYLAIAEARIEGVRKLL